MNSTGILGKENLIPMTKSNNFGEVMSSNLKSVFFLSQTVSNYMKYNGVNGNILNVSSSSNIRPTASTYTLSKLGIRGLTPVLAKSYTPYGITVDTIAPEPTETTIVLEDDNLIFKNNI